MDVCISIAQQRIIINKPHAVDTDLENVFYVHPVKIARSYFLVSSCALQGLKINVEQQLDTVYQDVIPNGKIRCRCGEFDERRRIKWGFLGN